jgi:hypothetical protein
MSGKNNVNPGQYKVAGREKPDDLARERMKNRRVKSSANSSANRKTQRNKAR